MNDTDIRQSDIDSAAAMLLNGNPLMTARQWHAFARVNHGRTHDVYVRCAELAQARQEMAQI